MDTFSPSRCNDAVWGQQTDGERYAYFYRSINELKGASLALNGRLETLQNSAESGISKNSDAIAKLQARTTSLQLQIVDLQQGFAALRTDNDRFQAEVSASNDNALKRVAAVEGLANSVSASVISLQNRVSKLEGVINPDELNTILERVGSLSQEIAQEVSKQVAAAEARLNKTLSDGIFAQNSAIAAIQSVANSAVSVAGQAQQSAADAQEKVAQLRTDITAKNVEMNVNLQTEIERAANAESAIKSDLNSEKIERRNADLVLQHGIDNVDSALQQEIKDRQKSDSDICVRVQKNADDLAVEQKARKSADETLQKNIDAEEKARKEGDTNLCADLTAENERAEKAEKELKKSADAEKEHLLKTEQEIAEWANGNGNDYHVGEKSVGQGLKGAFDRQEKKQDALAFETRDALAKAEARITSFDDRLTRDEVAIEKNKTDIAANKADIAANKADITANKADIAATEKRIEKVENPFDRVDFPLNTGESGEYEGIKFERQNNFAVSVLDVLGFSDTTTAGNTHSISAAGISHIVQIVVKNPQGNGTAHIICQKLR